MTESLAFDNFDIIDRLKRRYPDRKHGGNLSAPWAPAFGFSQIDEPVGDTGHHTPDHFADRHPHEIHECAEHGQVREGGWDLPNRAPERGRRPNFVSSAKVSKYMLAIECSNPAAENAAIANTIARILSVVVRALLQSHLASPLNKSRRTSRCPWGRIV